MAPTGEGESTLFQYGIGEMGTGLNEDGHRRLKQPRGISVCDDGALLVADFGNHCVLRFGQGDAIGKIVAGEQGKNLPTVDPLKDIDRPTGPADGEGFLMKRPIDVCAHDQSGVLVLDSEVCRIQHYAASGEKATTTIPPPFSPPQKSVNNPESIKYPRSMVQRPSGDIVICDTWSHRVFCYPADGGAAQVIAGKSNSGGTAPELLNFPSGMAFDSEGRLYVTDTNNHRVQCFLPGETRGATVAGSATGEPGTGLDQLNMPTGICIDARDGSLLVADRLNARVLRFPAGGAQKGEVVAGADQQLSRPWGVCQDGEGALYISDERKALVLKVEAPHPLSSSPQTGGYPVQTPATQPKAAPSPPSAPPPALQVKEEQPACAGNHNELD